MKGKIFIVGIGPGDPNNMTYRAYQAIKECQVLIGYTVYIEQVKELAEGKEIIKKGMGQEIERAKIAIEKAAAGNTVAVVCSGDCGLYGMSGLILELLKDHPQRQEIAAEPIPGITSAVSCSSLLGAPIVEDFCTISLSDYMTPWERIIQRLENACTADFVIALYNPRSLARPDYLQKAMEIIKSVRPPETPIGVVRNAYREDQSVFTVALKDFDPGMVDMFCTVLIGNSRTYLANGLMITSRGYRI